MKRREVLKYAATAVMGAPLLSTVLFGSTSIPSSIINAYKPVFFSQLQLNLVKAISDTILPKTDSPSASEVGVPEKIDHMIFTTFQKDQKNDYLVRFRNFENYIHQSSSGIKFWELDNDDRFELLSKLNDSSSNDLEAHRWALWDIKSRTVDYYRKMPEIATTHLNYLPIPGYYDPCVSLKEMGGKAWAI